MFISMDEVRKTHKKEGADFQRGYFEAYNNPQRIRANMPKMKEAVNQLLISGNLSKGTAAFFEGVKIGLADREKVR